MRVTQSSYYNNLRKDQKNTQHEIVNVNRQIASGKSIEYGYENPEVFSDTLRLDNEINGLQQAETIAQRAVSFTDYTDSSLSDMKDVLDKFKVKLINAANDSNATSSLIAIANELHAYKDHLVNLANAKGNGKFLFSGTQLQVPPIDAAGNYNGNDGVLKAFLGDDIKQPYSIPGSELFLGENGDIHRKISTNVQLFNQSNQHPESMIQGGVPEQKKDVLLTRFDTIRDMVGDDDSNPNNNENTFFYIRGRRSDGFSFKDRIELDSQAKVEDLLDRIGIDFGNTARSKVVDVSIDNAGYIEITDHKTGSSKIDFHMVSSTEDVDDIDKLATIGAQVETYNNSNYNGARTNVTVSATNSKFDHRDFSLNTVLKDINDKYATEYSLVRDVLPVGVDEIVLNGADVDGKPVKNATLKIGDTTTMKEYLDFIEYNFSGKECKLRARLSDGQILLADDSITRFESSELFLSMKAKEKGADIKGFTALSGLEYDRAYWAKDGSKLTASVPQITKKDNLRATNSTKILDVAGDITTIGTHLALQGKDIYGKDFNYTLNFDKDPKCATFTNNDTHKSYDIISHGYTTGGDELTYQQLFDVMGMIMTNNVPVSSAPTYIEDYIDGVRNADDMIKIGFTQTGQLTIQDKLHSVTKMEMAMFDKKTNDYSDTKTRNPLLTFHANNTITVDDPKTDFFALIDGAIKAVELERKHADGTNSKDPRNIGVQNSIVSIEHLMDQVTNSHSKNGAQSNSIRFAQDRNAAWIVNAKAVQSKVIDTDVAEASMKFNQLSNNYQAMLSTVGKVNKLALVNYL